MFLATKFKSSGVKNLNDRGVSGRPEYVRNSRSKASVKRLGVDVIDLHHQDRIDPNVPVEDTVGTMGSARERGKGPSPWAFRGGPIRFAGRKRASHHARRERVLALDAGAEEGVLAVCNELGIGFVPDSPLGRGVLTGKITKLDDLAQDDLGERTLVLRRNFKKNLELAHRLSEMAAEKGCTAGQLALAWVLAQGEYIVPIFGQSEGPTWRKPPGHSTWIWLPRI